MAWGLIILCLILGAFGTLRLTGRAKDFKRPKSED